MLAVDEELPRGHDRFLKLGDVFMKRLHAEGVGLGEGISGDGVFVAPVVVFEVGGELALVFEADIDEVGDGGEDRFSEFLRSGGFAVSEIGEKGEAGHGHRFVGGPGSVLVLSFVEPPEGLDHGVFAFLAAAIAKEALHAVLVAAAFFENARDARDTASRTIAGVEATAADSGIEANPDFATRLVDRRKGHGVGGHGADGRAGHVAGWGGFAGHRDRGSFDRRFLVGGVDGATVFRERKAVGAGGEGNDHEDHPDEGHHEEGHDDAGEGGGATLGSEALAGFRGDLGVEAHGVFWFGFIGRNASCWSEIGKRFF